LVYANVRSLERGLQLLQMLAESGFTTPAKLAAASGIDRTTIYRLLATLQRCGYVQQQADGGGVGLSSKLAELASGLHQQDQVMSIIAERLETLVSETKWPSDYGAIFAGRLRILASTHHKTSMTFFRRMTGKDRPILRTALGHAILAAVDDYERESILSAMAHSEGDRSDMVSQQVTRIVETTRLQGYAAAESTFDSKISAIALPIHHAGRVLGAINIVFFRTAMSAATAAERHLAALRATVSSIEQEIDQKAPVAN
jgi:IclR family mhp operon transcriptional activator